MMIRTTGQAELKVLEKIRDKTAGHIFAEVCHLVLINLPVFALKSDRPSLGIASMQNARRQYS
jgi:hypothetical protein